jgi:hypothetical protein
MQFESRRVAHVFAAWCLVSRVLESLAKMDSRLRGNDSEQVVGMLAGYWQHSL